MAIQSDEANDLDVGPRPYNFKDVLLASGLGAVLRLRFSCIASISFPLQKVLFLYFLCFGLLLRVFAK